MSDQTPTKKGPDVFALNALARERIQLWREGRWNLAAWEQFLPRIRAAARGDGQTLLKEGLWHHRRHGHSRATMSAAVSTPTAASRQGGKPPRTCRRSNTAPRDGNRLDIVNTRPSGWLRRDRLCRPLHSSRMRGRCVAGQWTQRDSRCRSWLLVADRLEAPVQRRREGGNTRILRDRRLAYATRRSRGVACGSFLS